MLKRNKFCVSLSKEEFPFLLKTYEIAVNGIRQSGNVYVFMRFIHVQSINRMNLGFICLIQSVGCRLVLKFQQFHPRFLQS